MVDGVTRYNDPGVSPRTEVYAAVKMLEAAQPVIVLGRLGSSMPMPKNKGQVIVWRRARTFAPADKPLQEGVTPNATQFRYDDVPARLKQYGQVVEVTDVIEDTHEDPVLRDAAEQAGENIGRTLEALTFGTLVAGTNVFYSTAAATARSDVNTPITLNKIRAVVRMLQAQKATPITRIMDSSVRYATRWVEGGYVAVSHTDIEPDLRGLAGFLPVAAYGTRTVISEYEVGTIEKVRFILTPDAPSWDAAGAAHNGMITSDGVSADVYPVLFFGRNAFGVVPLRGEGSVEPTIIRSNVRTKDDPLGQRGYVGWKTWHAAAILNQLWMARLEVATTLL